MKNKESIHNMGNDLITGMLQLTADIAEELLLAKDDGFSRPEASTCSKIERLYQMSVGTGVEQQAFAEPEAEHDVEVMESEAEVEHEAEMEHDAEMHSTDVPVAESDSDSGSEAERESEAIEGEEAADALPDGPTAEDLRRAMSINDIFLFRRALFGGSAQRMNDALADMAGCTGIGEISRLLVDKYGVNLKQPEAKAFIAILQPFFEL